MSNPLVEISIDLVDQLEEALEKNASIEARLLELTGENARLNKELEDARQNQEITKAASTALDAELLAATTSLEKAGFFAPGTAVNAYKTLKSNSKELPVLLEKLASALGNNFNDGTFFTGGNSDNKKSGESDPWKALLD